MKKAGRRKPGKTVIRRGAEAEDRNRELFRSRGLFVLNLIGSPGCGKTTLLERTLRLMKRRGAVIEGDIRTTIDRDRIRATGAPAVQIETHGACHLDPAMVERALAELDLTGVEVLFIENVGNLVCPAGTNLGEDMKVAVTSVPEGDEKPAKYPALFVRAGAVVINKTDLLRHVDYDLERAAADCRKLNSGTEIFPLSAKTGEGFDAWLRFIEEGAAKAKGRRRDVLS